MLVRIGGVSALVVALVAGAVALLASVVGGMVFTATTLRPPPGTTGVFLARAVTGLALLGITVATGVAFLSAAAALCLVVAGFLTG